MRHARKLLEAAWPLIAANGLTLIGISLSNLDDADAVQLSLPIELGSDDRLDGVLDAVRAKFGSMAVQRTVHLGVDQGLCVPMLPD